jgi:hypothetical protein
MSGNANIQAPFTTIEISEAATAYDATSANHTDEATIQQRITTK